MYSAYVEESDAYVDGSEFVEKCGEIAKNSKFLVEYLHLCQKKL